MKTRRVLRIAGGALAALLIQNCSPRLLQADVPMPAALSGHVASAEEGPMEGVVVSAKKDGSTITVSVVTNAAGRFAFPTARLEPGHYTLKARAAGYELDGARAADVAAGQEAKADLKLKKSQEPVRPAHQCGVAGEHAGHGGTEEFPAQLHWLPHAGAHHEIDA